MSSVGAQTFERYDEHHASRSLAFASPTHSRRYGPPGMYIDAGVLAGGVVALGREPADQRELVG